MVSTAIPRMVTVAPWTMSMGPPVSDGLALPSTSKWIAGAVYGVADGGGADGAHPARRSPAAPHAATLMRRLAPAEAPRERADTPARRARAARSRPARSWDW